MKIIVVSYSYTGNNEILAEGVARQLSAKHIKITVQKPMTIGTIIMDMVFARTPRVHPSPDILRQYDLVLFFGPVWIGQLASPLRGFLNYLKNNPRQYGFLSISGGADGSNPKLSSELFKRTGIQTVIMLDQHIKDLLPQNPKPSRKDTSGYRLSESEQKRLSDIAVGEINKIIEAQV